MKTFVCVFQSLADFQQCYSNGKPASDAGFLKYQKQIDSQVARYIKQGADVERILVNPDEYLSWLNSNDSIRVMTEKEQMAAFANFKGNQTP